MALSAPSRRAAAALAILLVLGVPGAASAQGDTYKQHMDNGVKLFADRNFAAATVEFQAAYDARPSPNPLVNIALCAKEMFRYPQAIATLETALARHGAAMDPADRKAAEDAIKEMRSLLGSVTVAVTPKDAKLVIDGEEQPAGAAGKPIPLGPGAHKIAARAEGFASAEQTVSVKSGGEETVTIALVPEKGEVTIEAPDPRAAIFVDDRPVGIGLWTGLLPPGAHVVQFSGLEGPPLRMSIVVVAGAPLLVRKGEGGVPIVPPPSGEPRRFGVYVFGLGSMLFSFTHAPAFPTPLVKPDFGAGYGLRVGFQVNKIAGFEATYEHSSIFTYQVSAMPNVPNNYYRIIANRFALGLRLISSGSLVRFAGSFGGGFVLDTMNVYLDKTCTSMDATSPCFLVGTGDHPGVDAFAMAEAGLELDLDHVLLDFGVEGEIQSTGNMTGVKQRPVFGSLPLLNGGPMVRIGYRFW